MSSTHPHATALDQATLFLLARRVVNFTQEDWARELGVTHSTVYRWEHGLRAPTQTDTRLVREVLRRPLLRRRVYLNEQAEALLIMGGLVEPIEDCVRTYRELRSFLREIKVLPTRSQASA